jgi:rod shape-determining protein MreD
MRAVFLGVTLLVLLVNLLPLQTLTRGWTGPDLVFCFALVWCVRAPNYVPLFLLALVFLLADFLLSRPPGLMAALMLLACNDLQARMARNRDSGLLAEWVRASVLIFAVMLAYRVVLGLLLVPVPSMTLLLLQALVTALSYPIIVGVSALLFGVRHKGSGEFDRTGHRA